MSVKRAPLLVVFLSHWSFDTTVSKDIKFTERFGAMFVATLSNLFNHPLFHDPYLDLSGPKDFGVISGKAFGGSTQINRSEANRIWAPPALLNRMRGQRSEKSTENRPAETREALPAFRFLETKTQTEDCERRTVNAQLPFE